MPPEKIINFLLSDEFYDEFLLVVENFNIKSNESFIKFAEIFKFFDGWFRENWSKEESENKSKEILINFDDTERDKIVEFVFQNFDKQRIELWQTKPETELKSLNISDEKERRYLEIMANLVKFPEERQQAKEENKLESMINNEGVSMNTISSETEFRQKELPQLSETLEEEKTVEELEKDVDNQQNNLDIPYQETNESLADNVLTPTIKQQVQGGEAQEILSDEQLESPLLNGTQPQESTATDQLSSSEEYEKKDEDIVIVRKKEDQSSEEKFLDLSNL
ncbi:MAG: hypothetical protein NZ822_00415 [Patescibacteria group bacterium]|nr:hypothetical protein [Patescibacteria group bacterium]